MKKCKWSFCLLPVFLGGYVYAATFNVTPDNLNFGIVPAGKSADQIFTVQNTGDSPLVYSVSADSPYSIITAGDYRSLNMTATASSETSGWPASSVVYGIPGTWASAVHGGANYQEWIQLDLGQTVSLSGALLTPRIEGIGTLCFPVDYRFECSTNGTTWTVIPGASYTNQPNPSAPVTHIFSLPITARYLRVVATKLRTDTANYYFQLTGFEPLSASNTYSVATGSNQNIAVRYNPSVEGIHTQAVHFISEGETVTRDVVGTTGLKLVADTPFGSGNPPAGTNLYAYGTAVTCSVLSVVNSNGTNYTCTGWIGTGDIPATGNDNSTSAILLTNLNSSITWLWQVSGDRDGDGIPDTWAYQYSGNATGVVASALAANGINTLLEAYVAGLNPTNAQSRFEFSCNAPVDKNYAQIYFTTATGREYTVEYRTSLTEGDWQPVTSLTGSGIQQTLKDYSIGQKKFYRVTVNMAK